MVVSVTMSLADIARDAAASAQVTEYLELRGLRTAATLALLCKYEDGLERTLIEPLLQGWTKQDGSVLAIQDSDKPIARAVLLHMWLLSRQQRTAAHAPSCQQPTSSAASEDKIPKTLPAGKWSALLNEYQAKQDIFAHGRTESPREARAQHNEVDALGEKELAATPEEPWTPRSILTTPLQSVREGDCPELLDGIGSAAHILADLTEGISLHISWEIDQDCISVIKQHYPAALHRGDFLADDPHEVAKIIREHDPHGQMLIVFASAPPCLDFSRIREDAPGAEGSEGQKFTACCGFASQVEMELPNKRVGHLTENVIMEKGEAGFFALRLDCNAVAADAQASGLVNRPRLWWTRIDWSKPRHSPITGHQLRWSKMQKFHRLHHDGPLPDPDDIKTRGPRLHHKVASHECRMPCFVTPASSEAGRPPPKTRWPNDQKTFAPWQFAEETLLHEADGAMVVPPPAVKEQLHQLPIDYTLAWGVRQIQAPHAGEGQRPWQVEQRTELRAQRIIPCGSIGTSPNHPVTHSCLSLILNLDSKCNPLCGAACPG
eukprot:s2362_g6.t1